MPTTRAKVAEIVLDREHAIKAIKLVNKHMKKKGRTATRFTNLSHGARRVKWWLIGNESIEKLGKKFAKHGITYSAEAQGMYAYSRPGTPPNSLIIWIPADMLPSEATKKAA